MKSQQKKQTTVLAVLLFLHCSLYISPAWAQDDPEYRMEVGAGLGLMAYEGDFNGNLLKGMQPKAAVVAKYKMNPRMAWSAQIAMGKLKGSTKNVKTWYPYLNDHPMDFKTSLTDVTVRYEYNFWPFGTGREYLGAKPLTPFFAIGTGLCFTGKPKVTWAPVDDPIIIDGEPYIPETEDATVSGVLLFGAGVKYKLQDRLNLIAEWTMHFTATDRIDGVVDPYGIKSTGIFKNTDCYSALQLTVTYDLWAKCKTCHNDRD